MLNKQGVRMYVLCMWLLAGTSAFLNPVLDFRVPCEVSKLVC